MAYWVMEFYRSGVSLEDIGSYRWCGAVFCLRSFSVSLLPGFHEINNFAPPYPSAMTFCLTMAQKQWNQQIVDCSLWFISQIKYFFLLCCFLSAMKIWLKDKIAIKKFVTIWWYDSEAIVNGLGEEFGGFQRYGLEKT
jgi:hypothetical protein